MKSKDKNRVIIIKQFLFYPEKIGSSWHLFCRIINDDIQNGEYTASIFPLFCGTSKYITNIINEIENVDIDVLTHFIYDYISIHKEFKMWGEGESNDN